MRDLRRNLLEQVELARRKGVGIDARDVQRSQAAAARHERDAAQRLQGGRQQRRLISGKGVEIFFAEHASNGGLIGDACRGSIEREDDVGLEDIGRIGVFQGLKLQLPGRVIE